MKLFEAFPLQIVSQTNLLDLGLTTVSDTNRFLENEQEMLPNTLMEIGLRSPVPTRVTEAPGYVFVGCYRAQIAV